MPDEIPELNQALDRLEAIGSAALDAAFAQLYREAEAIMAVSKEERVPVDEGILKGSGHVQAQRDDLTVTLAYGGPAEAYAFVQHENLTFNHPNGGGAKYLEGPALEAASRLGGSIAAAIRRALGKE